LVSGEGGLELYCRILQPGCRIEKLGWEAPERLGRGLAVYRSIAWRSHYLTPAARVYPNAPCTQVVDVEHWQTIYLWQTHKRPPQTPPPLRRMRRMWAQLGGFLARTGDGEPGGETSWRG
jgi:Transposase Tn5 dimerisation domain